MDSSYKITIPDIPVVHLHTRDCSLKTRKDFFASSLQHVGTAFNVKLSKDSVAINSFLNDGSSAVFKSANTIDEDLVSDEHNAHIKNDSGSTNDENSPFKLNLSRNTADHSSFFSSEEQCNFLVSSSPTAHLVKLYYGFLLTTCI